MVSVACHYPTLINIARSSNGRTQDFGSWYWGSNPCRAAKLQNHQKVMHLSAFGIAFYIVLSPLSYLLYKSSKVQNLANLF